MGSSILHERASFAGLVPTELLACAFLFWGMVLISVWVSPLSLELKRQHADRIASCFHAVTATAFGVATLLFLEPTCTLSYARPQWILVGQLSTAGWLCVDTCNMLVVDVWYGFRKVDPSVFVHHFCVIFCLFVS